MSNPLIYGGIVIVGEGNQTAYHDPAMKRDTERLLIGTGESAIIGVDARSGRLRWRVATKGTAMPTGAIVDGMLVHHDGAGFVRAIDPKNGRVRYQHFIESVASMSALVPLADGNVVTAGTYPAAVIAFSASRGRVAWKHQFASNASGSGDCPPATDGRRIYCNYFVPANGGPHTELGQGVVQHVYAVDAHTGALDWDIATQSGPLAPYNEASIPLLDKGELYEGNAFAYWMNAIDANTGKFRWRTHLFGAVRGGISVKDGVLYFGDSDGHLSALDESTGHIIGVKDVGAQFAAGSPIIAGDTLIIASRTGSIIAVSLAAIRNAHDV
jgi:outer membrane protein assembly factor BamB